MNIPDGLKPGDILLYASPSLVDKVIETVEGGDDVAHVEVYAGNGKSWASRNGIGVGIYDFRADGLKYARRPLGFDYERAATYFTTVVGLPYGFGDCLADVGVNNALPGMHCSHFGADIMEHGSCPQFDRSFPKKLVRPRDFKLSNQAQQIWPTVEPPI